MCIKSAPLTRVSEQHKGLAALKNTPTSHKLSYKQLAYKQLHEITTLFLIKT